MTKILVINWIIYLKIFISEILESNVKILEIIIVKLKNAKQNMRQQL
jgi:multisubunit Na+/H+ antiporter MnhE subunit